MCFKVAKITILMHIGWTIVPYTRSSDGEGSVAVLVEMSMDTRSRSFCDDRTVPLGRENWHRSVT